MSEVFSEEGSLTDEVKRMAGKLAGCDDVMLAALNLLDEGNGSGIAAPAWRSAGMSHAQGVVEFMCKHFIDEVVSSDHRNPDTCRAQLLTAVQIINELLLAQKADWEFARLVTASSILARSHLASTYIKALEAESAAKDRLHEIKVRELESKVQRMIEHDPKCPEVRKKVSDLTGGKCAYCDEDLDASWHVDHIVAKSYGGPDHLANFVPSCGRCNVQKASTNVVQFISKRKAA